MTWTLAIALVSVFLSVISTAIAIASFRRTSRLQDIDYSSRLQICDERIECGGVEGPDDVFSYSAIIENVGLKPVRVEEICVDYGSEHMDKCFKHHVDGRFDLAPNSKRTIAFSLSQACFVAALERFEIEHCYFRLRVTYLSPNGKIAEVVRTLAGVGTNPRATFYAQAGDALT